MAAMRMCLKRRPPGNLNDQGSQLLSSDSQQCRQATVSTGCSQAVTQSSSDTKVG